MIQALLPLQKLHERLEAIRVTNGFRTDAGEHVFRGRTYLDGATELPGLTILENEEERTEAQVDASMVRETTPYEIRGIVESDHANPLDAGHRLVADVKQALFLADTAEFEFLDGTAVMVEYTGRQITGPEDGSNLTTISVFLSITHAETLGYPEEA